MSKSGLMNAYYEAIKYFTKALELGHTQKAYIYDSLGTAWIRLKQFKEAIACFELAFNNLDKDMIIPSVFFLAAEANEATGNTSEAIKWYKRYNGPWLPGYKEDIRKRLLKLRAKRILYTLLPFLKRA